MEERIFFSHKIFFLPFIDFSSCEIFHVGKRLFWLQLWELNEFPGLRF